MNRADRAKQFCPFDALKGLQEELRAREEKMSRVEKKDISEEQAEQIASVLMKIYKQAEVDITFYRNGHYLNVKGVVQEKNDIYKYLTIGQSKIFYDDIFEIKIENI